MSKTPSMNKRDFLKKAGLVSATAATSLAAPHVARAQAPITWRMQTYAGPALAEHVVKNSIDWFNTAANGEMVIELYTADQLVPQGELFRAVQAGTIDAAQSDDDSAAAPVDIKVFAAYFPFASRYSLDVPALWNWHGLKEIWEEAYAEVEGVTWLSTGSWDPCNFGTTKPIRSLEDLKGLRVYTFPTGGQFLSQFGVVPVTLPYEDVQPAIQTGELDGVCWCGITEMVHGGLGRRAQVLPDQPDLGRLGRLLLRQHREVERRCRRISSSSSSWRSTPPTTTASTGTGRARRKYRTTGPLELTSIPDAEWKTVEDAALVFWDEIAAQSPRNAKVVEILKDYNAQMIKAGPPYRYGA